MVSATALPGKRIWKKALLLGVIGVALWAVPHLAYRRVAPVFLSDVLFSVGSVFLVAGLWGVVKNMGMFNSMKYGTKSLLRMFRGKREQPKDKMMGGYLEYVRSRPKDKEAPWLVAMAALLLLLASLASIPFL